MDFITGKCNTFSRQHFVKKSRIANTRVIPFKSLYLVSLFLTSFVIVLSLTASIDFETPSKPLISHLVNIRDGYNGLIKEDVQSKSTSLETSTSSSIQEETIQTHSGAPIVGTDISTTPNSSQPPPTDGSENNIFNEDESHSDDGLCRTVAVTRRSLLAPTSKIPNPKPINVTERALFCHNVDHLNHRQMAKSIHKRNKSNIQQIQLSQSEPIVIFSAIDLICDRFNCSKLAIFNLTGQEIRDFSMLSSWISSWPQLEILDLSNTSLSTIESIFQVNAKSSKPLKNLASLILDNNNIVRLDFNYLFEVMPNLRFISLINNTLTSIECNETLKDRVKRQFESINLAYNTINCDKNQLWLTKQFVDPQASTKYPEHDQIKCSSPDRMIEMTWSQRVSVLESPICDECDCKSLKRTAISVDCHNKNLTALPDVLPINTKILNLTNNQIHSIGVPQNSKNWENVTYVYLENNLITHFQPLEIKSKFMRNLAALDIRRNKFQEFPSHIFEQFINLDQVHLSNNPWLCDCESTFAFQEWLQRHFQKVGDKEDIVCGISGSEENGLRSNSLHQRLSARVIYRLSKSELCPQDNLEEPYDWLDILNCVLGITIVIILTKVTLDYFYQRRTKRLPHFFKMNL